MVVIEFPITSHYRKCPRRSVASGAGFLFPDKRNATIYRKYIWESVGVLANRKEESRIGCMRPSEKKTTSECTVLYQETLKGKNFSKESIRAYRSDLQQFLGWLKTRRVDWDIPHRI